MTPTTPPPSWPYVSRKLDIAWIPNWGPFRPPAVYITPGSKAADLDAAPDVFYRFSSHVAGRLLAAIDRLPAERTEHLEAAAEAHRLLRPLLAWLSDRYRDAALQAGAIAADGWQDLDDEIAEARRAPASGTGSMPLPKPEATEREIAMLERVTRQDRQRTKDLMLWCPLYLDDRPVDPGDQEADAAKPEAPSPRQPAKNPKRTNPRTVVERFPRLFGE